MGRRIRKMEKLSFHTREDFVKLLENLCRPLDKYYSDHSAFLQTGYTGTHYGVKITGLEGFSRILWGLVPLWMQGDNSPLDVRVLEGIRHGSDREDSEYWGDFPDGSQAFVEMAPLGFALLFTPERVWEPLSAREKRNLNTWLLQINEHTISDNNWLFFRVLVNCGLKKAGGTYSSEQTEKDLERIDQFYLEDGWYSDGKTRQVDYYIGFAMHFYGLVYAAAMESEDGQRARKFRERARLFAEDFIYWFGTRGEAVPYGRSLTYRFAQVSFWSALAFCGETVFSWGIIKGIICRHFRYWFSLPILDCEDKLTIGYAYPNMIMSEGYNSPNGVYWALKSLLILALPEDHAFWQAEEEPLPKLESVRILRNPGMIIQRNPDGYVTALASGQFVAWNPVHDAEKYEKFAYSSFFGFQVARSYCSIAHMAPDNMLAFYRDGYYHIRRRCDSVSIRENGIYSVWSPCRGVKVETELIPSGMGHIRQHRIISDEDITAVEGGFALPWDETEEVACETAEQQITLTTRRGTSSLRILQGDGKGSSVFCEANVNVLYPRTVLPYFQYHISSGETVLRVYVEGIPAE